MKNRDRSTKLGNTSPGLGRPNLPEQTQLPRGQDPIDAHVGAGPDGYDQGTPDYDILRAVPIAKTIDYGAGPKVAKREAEKVPGGRDLVTF